MDIQIKKGKLFNVDADVYIIPVFEKDNLRFSKKLCDRLDDKFKNLLNQINFEYKKKTYFTFEHKGKIRRVIFLGLGEKEKIDAEKIRKAAGFISKITKEEKNTKIATCFWCENKNLAKAQLEGFLLSDYEYNKFKTEKKNDLERNLIIADNSLLLSKTDIEEIKILVDGVNMAKDLINAPSNYATPTLLAECAKKIALKNKKIKLKIYDNIGIKKLGMNAFYSVASGSDEPARFIICEYYGATDKKEKTVVIIGKGITFDSGGISLKPQATQLSKIENMKYDMSGAACVLGLIKVISELELKINVVGLIPATENMPSGKAYKPGDIIKTLSGKTVEVISTDAEGRLLLADTITYSLRYKPGLIIDIATLTGACLVALGKYAAGLMGNNEKLIEHMKESGYNTGEKVWELPLWDEYKEQIKSKVADLKNVGGGDAATITAGIFLKEFVDNIPWLHLDIAGTAYDVKNKDYISEEGASGIGVRLIFDFIKNLREGK